MGFFSIKKKSSRSASPAPVADSTRQSSGPSTIPSSPIVPNANFRPTVQLKVAVHSASATSDGREVDELFWIEVDPEAEVNAIRRAISARTGGVPFALFKVNIPIDAFQQAEEYDRCYKDRVDLINHFPSFSLDDPTQIRPSLGQSGWQAQLPPVLRIKDWWPSPTTSIDTVSIIARPVPSSSTSTSTRPFTILAHFAAPAPSSGCPSSPSLHSPSRAKSSRRQPTPIDILPTSSIAQLKSALLTADSRPVAHLDKIVLWRVAMSSEEMIVIEQRGGLKSGQMPWPYPPTAQVPIPINDDSLPVSHYFPSGQSDTTNVSLSVWIYPSAQQALARITPIEALNAPSFRYPMIFPIPEIRRSSESHSLPALSPALEEVSSFDLSPNTLPVSSGRSRRARPSTAPATCDSASPPVFGAPGGGRGGLQSFRGRSPLAAAPAHASTIKGLGIAGSDLPPISCQEQTVDEMGVDLTRLSLKVNVGESKSSHPGQQEIIWQPAEGSLKRSGTGSRGIRSLANNRSLRAYEIC